MCLKPPPILHSHIQTKTHRHTHTNIHNTLHAQDNRAIANLAEQMLSCIASFGSVPSTMWYLTLVAAAAMRG